MKKDTVRQNIPSGWTQTKVGNLGFTYSGLRSKNKIDFGHGSPFITYMNIFTNSKIDKSRFDLVDVGEEENQNKVKYGDVFFTVSSETPEEVGMSSVLLDEVDNYYLNSFCFGFRLKDFNSLIPQYARYLFRGGDFRSKIIKMAQGSTRFNLSKDRVLSLNITLPTVKEQRKIAEILGTVDENIAKTQEVIEATEKLKRGLMQQLFTCGIGHTKFKETKIGQIPEEWGVVLLDTVAKRGSGHTPDKKKPEYYNGGIKWISLADSKLLDKGEINNTKIEISEKGINNSSAVLHHKGTVLLSRDAGIGKSAVMATNMAVSQHFITWSCSNKLNNWYLYHYLQSQKKVFERIAMGSTIKTIGLDFFKKYLVPLPSIPEQEKIAGTLSVVDEKISINKQLKKKLTLLKKGLMQDLLSGKKRV